MLTKEEIYFRIYNSDALSILKTLENNSISSVVTDPPYGLSDPPDVVDMLKGWLSPMGRHTSKESGGFMGRGWDQAVPQPNLWKEVFRVLKPGGYILCFAGTRTLDLMGLSLRIAGFEPVDCLMWLHAMGMPKGQNISKAFNKDLGLEQEIKKWEGFNTQLKPSNEPILLMKKPLEGTYIENIRKWGVGALNIDKCRVPLASEGEDPRLGGKGDWGTENMAKNIYAGGYEGERVGSSSLGRYPSNVILSHTEECIEIGSTIIKVAEGGSPDRNMKGIEEYWGEGGGGFKQGRSTVSYGDENGEETVATWKCHPNCPTLQFPESKGQQGNVTGDEPSDKTKNVLGEFKGRTPTEKREEKSVSAARFYFNAKASKIDRNKYCTSLVNNHVSVKPLALMTHLVNLVTPKEGVILDPFLGSGSTGIAALENGFNFIGCERNKEYCELSKERLTNCKNILTKDTTSENKIP